MPQSLCLNSFYVLESGHPLKPEGWAKDLGNLVVFWQLVLDLGLMIFFFGVANERKRTW